MYEGKKHHTTGNLVRSQIYAKVIPGKFNKKGEPTIQYKSRAKHEAGKRLEEKNKIPLTAGRLALKKWRVLTGQRPPKNESNNSEEFHKVYKQIFAEVSAAAAAANPVSNVPVDVPVTVPIDVPVNVSQESKQ